MSKNDRKKVNSLFEKGERYLDSFHEALRQRQPGKVKPGQVWLTKADYWSPSGVIEANQSYFILVLKGPEHFIDKKHPYIEAAIFSPHKNLATLKDYVVPEDIPVVGNSIICFWNTGKVPVENLDVCVVELARKILDQAEKVWARASGLDPEEYPLFDIPTGAPVISRFDYRLEFQEEFRQETDFLWQPVRELFKIAEIVETRDAQLEKYIVDIKSKINTVLDSLSGEQQPQTSRLAAGVTDYGLISIRKLESKENSDNILPLIEDEGLELWLTIPEKEDMPTIEQVYLRGYFKIDLKDADAVDSILITDKSGDHLISLENILLIEKEIAVPISPWKGMLTKPFYIYLSIQDRNYSAEIIPEIIEK